MTRPVADLNAEADELEHQASQHRNAGRHGTAKQLDVKAAVLREQADEFDPSDHVEEVPALDDDIGEQFEDALPAGPDPEGDDDDEDDDE